MEDPRDRPRFGASGLGGLHLIFPAAHASVRRALATVITVLRNAGVGPDACGMVELVLAEALNNVVEHAYEDRGYGLIELETWRDGGSLRVRLCDDGLALPNGRIPAPTRASDPVDRCDLPEGGFGWSIIRDLTVDLRYRRDGARNELSFALPLVGG
ncbi:ATP-binding protein [Maritimibacter sp. DP1N21-5]|nr:ATP-binding protein [Maritimibacter sp. DP1N21-5]